MEDDRSGAGMRCSVCGRDYKGQAPRFCLTCGTMLAAPEAGVDSQGQWRPPQTMPERTKTDPPGRDKPLEAKGPRPRGKHLAIVIVAGVLAFLLVAGAVAGIVVGTRHGGQAGPMPTTAEAMRSSVAAADGYLTGAGKALALGRTKGAPIYSVSSKLDADAATVSGSERILYTNTTGATLSEIVLRVYANSTLINPSGAGATISAAKVDAADAGVIFTGSLLHVALAAPLQAGREALVTFEFRETVPSLGDGAGGGALEQLLGQQSGTNYGVFGHSSNVFDLGYYIPTVAAYGMNGWESREVPAFGDVADFACAYYNVSIDVPSSYVVAAPGVKGSDKVSGGRKTCDFRAGPVRDFSVQASPDYKVTTTSVGETVISSYFLKDATDAGGKVLGYARDALNQFNTNFGPYPYRGLNVCEAPLGGGAGGMEFAGQVQLAQMLYSMSSGASTGATGELDSLMKGLTGGLMGDMLEFVTAHEVCHQWWGLVVGSDSIAHPWLDESLTNYCSVLYFRWQHGEDAAKKQQDMQLVMPYSAAKLFSGAVASGDMPVDTPVYEFTSEIQYSAIVYSKGALFFGALEKQMGAQQFDKSLKEYYEREAFREAAAGDLMAAFGSNGDSTAIAALQRRWILELHGDEDIAGNLPGGDLLNNLLKNLPNGGLDLNQLQDLLKNLVPDGSMPSLPFSPQDNSTEPTLPI